jgi:alpha-ketoglutarate-dependent dioxygenase FTO
LEGLYLYDSVQAGGQKVSQTFCKRTLIGEPGSTYRYLGLRLFSHPWCNVNSDGDKADNDDAVDMGYAVHHQQALLQMGQLNQILQKMTQEQLNQQLPDFSLHGSCEFNLTLVNRMAPTSEKRDLKLDPVLQAKASVSWHKDSGLADFSSIAIYHTLQGTEGKDPWRVALRVPKAKTPSLAVPLPSGAIYYLLDDFNHSHEHAVLAGSHQLRYSSTHRVTKPGGTWQTLREKCRQIMSTLNTNTPKTLRARLQLSRELEFEWIRQWCIQGQDHAQLHPYWHEPVEFMQDCWKQIHENAMTTLQELEKQESTRKDKNDLCDILIEALEECVQLRKEWEQRLIDPFFSTLPESSRPFRLGKSVDAISMKDLKAILILARTCRPQTKKEQLLVASNWQALQGKLKANK